GLLRPAAGGRARLRAGAAVCRRAAADRLPAGGRAIAGHAVRPRARPLRGGGGHPGGSPRREGSRPRRLLRGRPTPPGRARGARARAVPARDLRGVIGGEGTRARPPPRLPPAPLTALP